MHIHIIGSQWELTQIQFTAGNDDIYNLDFYEKNLIEKNESYFAFFDNFSVCEKG